MSAQIKVNYSDLAELAQRLQIKSTEFVIKRLGTQDLQTTISANKKSRSSFRTAQKCFEKIGDALNQESKNLKSIEYQDNKDRIEVERAFSLSRRCHGIELIMEKLEETQLTSIGISVLATNLFKIYKDIFSVLILMIANIRHKYWIYA